MSDTTNFNVKNIEFSKFDLKRNLKLPTGLTPELSELIGIIIGDGNIYTKDRFELTIVGDIIEDSEYHRKYIRELFKKLFNLEPIIKDKHFKHANCIRMNIKSKALLSFFTKIIGLKTGKKENIKIPEIITNSDKDVIYSFIRGIADTDFCIRFKTRYGKKNYYPIIIGNFSDKYFVYQLKDLFEKIGFHSHIENKIKYDKVRKKNYFSYAINIVGKRNLENWMQKIGFKNRRHLVRYDVWKKFGFCPAYTNIGKGELILNNK